METETVGMAWSRMHHICDAGEPDPPSETMSAPLVANPVTKPAKTAQHASQKRDNAVMEVSMWASLLSSPKDLDRRTAVVLSPNVASRNSTVRRNLNFSAIS